MRRELLFAAGVTAGLAGLGCSNTSETEPTTTMGEFVVTSCEADHSVWQPAPSNLNFGPIADILGVSVERLQRGTYGPAICEKLVELESIAIGEAVVSINDMDSPCFVIGTVADPRDNKSSDELLVICPADNPEA